MNNIYRKPNWKVGNCGGTANDSGRLPPPVKTDGVWCMDVWSVRFDNQHVMKIMLEKPKMTVSEIINIITNEGGSVDEYMIVHRG